MSGSVEQQKEEKASRKAAMKAEAESLGISYEELKKQKKRKKREADDLESTEHLDEVKRMRTWSNDFDKPTQKRRTRSMDAGDKDTEPQLVTPESFTPLTANEWRKSHNITIRGHGAKSSHKDFTAPFFEFKEAPFCAAIQKSISQAGYKTPTTIQAQAWPLALEGNDLICVAKTGSGKTCGFLLPAFHRHIEQKGGMNTKRPQQPARTKPVMLVLAPTRELSVQILEHAQIFGRPLGLRTLCCYGGSSKQPQVATLERGVDVIVATPGRLNDLIEMRKADLSGIQYLVLDEADRMLDMVRSD